jgi:hypothetical protein
VKETVMTPRSSPLLSIAALLVLGSTAAHAEPQAEPQPEVNTVSVAADRESSKDNSPRVGVSPYGFGALYWAALHPTQSWRIVLPVQPVTAATTRD